jgi:predicted RNA-binding Zn ribbon-like protein
MISRRTLLSAIALLALPGSSAVFAAAGPAAALPLASSRDQWVAQAGRLVEAADSGNAPASSFRREVTAMRESLRELVRAADGEDRAALNDLVMMVALLDAAAACHRGGVIVCPPDLMRQMRAQMVRLQPVA